jgi:hypothetical protein
MQRPQKLGKCLHSPSAPKPIRAIRFASATLTPSQRSAFSFVVLIRSALAALPSAIFDH